MLPDKSPTLDILGTLACNRKPVSPAPPCVQQRYGEQACGAVLVFHVALVGYLRWLALRRWLLSVDMGRGMHVIKIKRFARIFYARLHQLSLAHVLQSFCEFASDIEKITSRNHSVGGTFLGCNNSFWSFSSYISIISQFNYFAIFVFLLFRIN
jgi:hypothetical protein